MKCCQNQRLRKRVIQGMEFEQCEECGFLYKKNVVSLELEKERYDLHICDDRYESYMKTICERVKPYLKKEKCLDYGCGKLPILAELLAQEGYPCAYYDLFYYPKLPKDRYGNIVMIEVFEHLKDPLEELEKLSNLLKKGGRLLIMTKPYLEETLDQWWYLRDITHLCFLRNDTLSHWDIPFTLICQTEDIFVLERI